MYFQNVIAPQKKILEKSTVSHLNSLPTPLSVLGVVGQSPHVHVALDDFWSEDVISVAQPGCCGFSSAVKSKGLRSKFGGYQSKK